MAIATKLNYTPEDLLSMPDRGHCELIDGQLVERNVSYESSFLAAVVNARLMVFVLANRLGWVVQADCGLQIFPADPSKVRFADGAFVSRNRPDATRPTTGHLRIAPDLVLEVVSPNDVATDVEIKVAEYLEAGVRLIWVVSRNDQCIGKPAFQRVMRRIFNGPVAKRYGVLDVNIGKNLRVWTEILFQTQSFVSVTFD
jgi:Uma2 family endonuclease